MEEKGTSRQGFWPRVPETHGRAAVRRFEKTVGSSIVIETALRWAAWFHGWKSYYVEL